MEVPIVGRASELGQLRAALVAASGGAGRLVLVSGEPGIGKTRLVAAVAEMAGEYGVPAAAGFAIDDPGMPPLWPWSVVSQSVPGLAGVLAGGGVFDESPGGAADSESARFVMFAAACRALADAAAERGLLVVLEDLQWADRTSLLLLRHLAGELARSRLARRRDVPGNHGHAAGRPAARAAARRRRPADPADRVVATGHRAMAAARGSRWRRRRAG